MISINYSHANVLTGSLRVCSVDFAKWVFITASYKLQDWTCHDLPHPDSEFQNFSNIRKMSTHTEICRLWKLLCWQNAGLCWPHIKQLTANSLGPSQILPKQSFLCMDAYGFQLHEWLAIRWRLSKEKFRKYENFCMCSHLSNFAKLLKFTDRVRQMVMISVL